MNVYLTSAAIVIVFFVFQFVEMRFFRKDEEARPLREVAWTALGVFVSAVVSLTLNEHLTQAVSIPVPEVFTGGPGF